MCGIAGSWQLSPTRDLEPRVRAMCDSLSHRGPDEHGIWTDHTAGLGLGHRRLSIVDLSPTGAQPMASHDGRWMVTFNGEIYNYRELRERLSAAGLAWRGSSDTEVLLEAVTAWGVDRTLQALAGMYALALWDRQERVLHLVRDRLGEKPLYAGVAGDAFLFGSELKALRSVPNPPRTVRLTAVASLLHHGYVSGPESIYTGIERVPPGGHFRIRQHDGRFEVERRRYWSVDETLRTPGPVFASLDGATDEFERRLTNVIADEMVADVPVGAFLSGGIDSSLVVATMQRVASRPVRTFTVAFEEAAFDESPYARAVARHLGTEHTELHLRTADALDLVERLPEFYDEPFADSSQLPTLLVSRITREHVTVALSGDAGDELFGGYSQYHLTDTIGRVVQRAPRVGRPALRALAAAAPAALYDAALSGRGTWGENARARVVNGLGGADDRSWYEGLLARWANPSWALSPSLRAELSGKSWERAAAWPSAADGATRKMAYDLQTYLPDDIMVKVDRAAMVWSLESRAPFLHHEIVEFALRLPLPYKIAGGKGKVLLRHALARHVPTALFERPKQGFAIPVAAWLRGPLRDWAEAQIASDAITAAWLDRRRVERIWREHTSGTIDHADRLWPILILMQWLRATGAQVH